MREQVFTQHLNRPSHEVWRFLSDLSNDCHWRPEIRRSTLVSGTAHEPGATYRELVVTTGLRVETTLRIVESVPGSALVLESENGYGSLSRYRFEAADGGTDLTLRFSMEVRDAPRLTEPFMWRLVTGWIDRDLKTLDRKMDEGPPCE